MKISTLCAYALLTMLLLSQRAQAFGGLWSSEGARVEQSAQKILFVDNPDSTITAVVEIDYTGPAQKFAWLIPVPGTPKIAVSSRKVFERLDAATAPEYWVEVARDDTCSEQDGSYPAADGGVENDAAMPEPELMPGPVDVLARGTVGPYDYVDIALDATLGDAAEVATDWLSSNGYELTGLDSTLFTPYLKDGLHLLAFKLSEGKDAGAIRPVMLTYESDQPLIPLRPAAVAAQADMGLQVWVIGPSQAVPDNYESLVLNDARIDWLSGNPFRAHTLPAGGAGPFGASVRRPSNYDALVSAAANEAGGRGFVTELAGPARQYRDKVWSELDDERFASIGSESYANGIDAVVAAINAYAGWDGLRDAIEGATALPDGVTLEEFARDPEQYRAAARVDTAEFLQLLEARVVTPVKDTAALLYNAPYLTRLYTRISANEMTVDPTFEYNAELAQLSNVHIARQFIECSSREASPWRIELPQGGVVVGEGESWPASAESLPANLKIVALGAHGSGMIVKDNSQVIGQALRKAAGQADAGVSALSPPQNGLLIGGTQDVRPRERASSTSNPSKPARSSTCGVTDAGAMRGSVLWFACAAGVLALRRRRPQRSAAGRVASAGCARWPRG
jgi:hypothetical protein